MIWDKPRLYVALHARGKGPKMPAGEDTYHWSFVVGPRKPKAADIGRRYHAKNTVMSDGTVQWQYHAEDTTMDRANNMLVRMTIAKVKDESELEKLFAGVKVSNDDPSFNCVIWLKDALMALAEDFSCLGPAAYEWETIRDEVMAYCKRKKEAGRFEIGKGHDMVAVSTYDLLEGKEIIP